MPHDDDLYEDEEAAEGARPGDPALEPRLSEAEMLALEAIERQEVERKQAEDAARLDALGNSLARTRAEAIQARQMSGIEQDWMEDEEFYQGIDDANRHEHGHAWRTKPPGQAYAAVKTTTQSIVFPNITAPFVNAASAKVSDILMPTDDAGFDLLPTPIPDLIEYAQAEEPPSGMSPEQFAATKDQAQAILDQAKAKAKKAKQRIVDWDVECQFHGEMRKVIKDAARLGSGVIKGPVPVKKRTLAWVDGTVVIQDTIDPASKHVDVWNFFPDGACGENIHNGSYTWERDDLTAKQLQDLKGTPGYIDWQIDKCIEEGAQRAVAFNEKDPNRLLVPALTRKFEIWYFHGSVEREDLEAAGCPCDEKQGPIPAMVTMVNSRVIRATFNPLDSGDFPYDIMPWQKRPGLPWGKGVARLGRTAQRIVVAAWRAKMDNAGLGSGPMWIVKDGTVTPIDGNYSIGARKGWRMGEDGDIDDVRKAFAFVEYPMMTAELDAIIDKGMKMMEDATGLPMLLQGQQGSAPEILGVVNLLNNNASSVLRELARMFDDYLTEPRVRRYYRWLLQYGKDDEKGEFVIDARGSSTNVEREIQKQEVAQLMQASLDPRFGWDPKKTGKQYLVSRHFDPKNFEYDDEEWKKVVENMSQGPQDPRIAVAQMRAQVDGQLKQMEQAFTARENALDRASEERENARDRELELVIAQIDAQLASAGLTSDQQKVLAEIKGRLGDTLVKVRAQQQMQREARAVEMSKPAVEPAGRAPNGKAYIQ